MKKIFNLLWMISIVSLSSISCTFAYTQEQKEAYQWAYKYGITTQPTIEDAKMNSPLTRQAFAKMVVNYLENIVWANLTTNSCHFPDENKITNNLKPHTKKVCAYEIMWSNWKNFNPTQPVDRAQLWTVISRMLWWNEYNASGKWYYIYHLNALKQSEIINNINNPQKKTKRWDVMIIFKRMYEKYGPNINMNNSENSAYSDIKISTNDITTDNTTSDYSIINAKPDSNGFMYYDSYLDRPALSNAMKNMKLRSTDCSNIFCQQVGDDGSYNNQKHYYWNEKKSTMILIPGVYYVNDCDYYDKIYWLDNNSLDTPSTNSDNSWIDEMIKNWKWDIIKAEDLFSKKENKHSAYVKLEKRALFVDEEYNYILKIWPEFVWYTMEVYYNDINEVAEIYIRSNSNDIRFQVAVEPREDIKYINFKYGNEYIWWANDERVFTRQSRYKNDWAELITNVKSWKSIDELDKQHNCKEQWF